jgi:hypothetical protein
MSKTNSLAIRDPGETTLVGGVIDEARELFMSFRTVFSPDRQRDRAVFWYEVHREQVLLRHVTNLKRQRKIDDHFVAALPAGQESPKVVLPIVIGNFAHDCSLSTVRWELYDDFELTSLAVCGRFDQRDLLPLEGSEGLSVQPVGNWDFDSLRLMHTCEHCRKLYNLRSIIYIPNLPCNHCGQCAKDVGRTVAQRLLQKWMHREATIAVHPCTTMDTEEFPIQYFVDPLSNSFVYWWLIAMGMPFAVITDVFGPLGQAAIQRIYRQSLFKYLAIANVRYYLQNYLEQVKPEGETDWIIFSGMWMRIAESLEAPFRQPQSETSWLNQQAIEAAKTFLPQFINYLILRHIAVGQFCTPVLPGKDELDE